MSRISRLVAASLLVGGLAFGAAAPVSAQGWGYGSPYAQTPGLDAQQWRQEQAQRQGMAQGVISPREAWRIDRAQDGLRRHEAWARADGVVTRQERWELRDHARRVDGAIAQAWRSPEYGHGYGRRW